MNSLKYKCDARTKTFLMLWLGFGFNLMAETEWSQIDWKEVEIRVFKLQKRIYRASQSGEVAKVHVRFVSGEIAVVPSNCGV